MDPCQARCATGTALTRAEQAWLDALPEVIEPAGRWLVCELGAAHVGPHLALGQAACQGDQWWWVRWAGQTREIVQIDPCHAEEAGAGVAEACLLCCGHPGPHSFHLDGS